MTFKPVYIVCYAIFMQSVNSAVSLVFLNDFKHFRTSRLALHSALLVLLTAREYGMAM